MLHSIEKIQVGDLVEPDPDCRLVRPLSFKDISWPAIVIKSRMEGPHDQLVTLNNNLLYHVCHFRKTERLKP